NSRAIERMLFFSVKYRVSTSACCSAVKNITPPAKRIITAIIFHNDRHSNRFAAHNAKPKFAQLSSCTRSLDFRSALYLGFFIFNEGGIVAVQVCEPLGPLCLLATCADCAAFSLAGPIAYIRQNSIFDYANTNGKLLPSCRNKRI